MKRDAWWSFRLCQLLWFDTDQNRRLLLLEPTLRSGVKEKMTNKSYEESSFLPWSFFSNRLLNVDTARWWVLLGYGEWWGDKQQRADPRLRFLSVLCTVYNEPVLSSFANNFPPLWKHFYYTSVVVKDHQNFVQWLSNACSLLVQYKIYDNFSVHFSTILETLTHAHNTQFKKLHTYFTFNQPIETKFCIHYCLEWQ